MSGYVWGVRSVCGCVRLWAGVSRCARVFEGVYGYVRMGVFTGCAQGCALAVVPCHKIIVA